MIGIYHSRDLDGIACGAIMKSKYPNIHLIGYHYGEPLELPVELSNTPVIMADVSVPMEQMRNIHDFSGGQFTWVDHHKSSIDTWNALKEDWQSEVSTSLKIGVGACELLYIHLFKVEGAPSAIRLLGKYDVWDMSNIFKWENEILPFQYGMRGLCVNPEDFPTWALTARDCDSHINGTIDNGRAIMEYESIQNKKKCQLASFEAIWKGFKIIAMNGQGFNSKVFESVYDEQKHALMMPFAFDGRQWTVSLYTTHDDIDCSKIAKSMGGGGHKKAAGFQLKDISDLNLKILKP